MTEWMGTEHGDLRGPLAVVEGGRELGGTLSLRHQQGCRWAWPVGSQTGRARRPCVPTNTQVAGTPPCGPRALVSSAAVTSATGRVASSA